MDMCCAAVVMSWEDQFEECTSITIRRKGASLPMGVDASLARRCRNVAVVAICVCLSAYISNEIGLWNSEMLAAQISTVIC